MTRARGGALVSAFVVFLATFVLFQSSAPADPGSAPKIDLSQYQEAASLAKMHRYADALAILDPLVEQNASAVKLRELRDDLRLLLEAETAGAFRTRTRISFQSLTSAQQTRVRVLSAAVAKATRQQAIELLPRVKALTIDAPDYPRAWLMQARLALLLNRPLEGRIAGRNLHLLDADSSRSAAVQRTLRLLRTKGWMERRAG